MSVIGTDYIYRSRITILDILEKRGYNTKPYSKFSPKEIDALISNYASLNMDLVHKDGTKHCLVIYLTSRITKQKIHVFFETILEKMDIPEDERANYEAVFMVQDDQLSDTYHLAAITEWTSNKRRIAFFRIPQIVVNPLDHILVPPHTIVPEEEHQALMTSLNITSKTQLPIIRFHVDPIARCLGLVPGDIVKIVRPSPSAGTYTVYRVCAP